MTNWKIKTLGEVLLKTETINPANSPDEEFDYIDVSSVSNQTYAVEATQRLKGRDAPSRARRQVRSGDVIFATIRPTLKRIAVISPEMDGNVCSTGYFVLRPSSEIDHRFLFHSLFTERFMGAMEILQKGASYPAVTDAEVRAQPISFPSLSEQRCIVAILDEAFEAIATARSNIEKNLLNAREMFEQAVERVFQDGATHWRSFPLDEIGKTQTGSTPKSAEPDHYGDALPFIKPGDFRPDGTIEYGNDGLSELGASRARVVPADSALMVCIGATIGKAGFCDRPIATNQQINAWSPHGDFSARFIWYQMTTRDFQRRVRQNAGQATLPIINKSKWGSLAVVVPPSLGEQISILQGLDAMGAQVDSLCEILGRKLGALDELKKSLLHQAFTGQLTAKTADKQLEAVA